MKKIISMLLVLAFSCALFAGCGSNNTQPSTTPAADPASPSASEPSTTPINYPTQSIEIVCTEKPGGNNDIIARALATYIEKALGTTVYVTNMNDGGQAPAIYYVHDAVPDGYTVLSSHDAFLTNQVNGSIDFGYEEMTLLGITTQTPGQILWARTDSGWSNLEDFAAACEANPNTYTLSLSYGGTTQIMGEMLVADGLQAKIVDSDSGSDRIVQLAGGHVDTAILSWQTGSTYYEAGEWVPLCIFDDERLAEADFIPTAKEQGYDASFPTNFTVTMPAGVDSQIVEIWKEALRNSVNDAEYVETIEGRQSKAVYIEEEESVVILDDSLKLIEQYLGG